ncbi:MAG: Asp23/Gls24 family envelope stress response protein [Clostridia bacterium]|nr:Asp23/Gls24 family envelope stress response protein [Clostridia bacterium]
MGYKNDTGIAISEDVITKMVATAALEVDGIAELAFKPTNIKGLIRGKSAKSVIAKFSNNAMFIDVFVKLKEGAEIVSVCENAQKTIKETLQNMTGKAVTKINIHVVDIEINDEDK